MKKRYVLIILLFLPLLLGAITSRYSPWWGLREQASAPTTPTNGVKFWCDSSNNVYVLNESGANYQLDTYDPNAGLTDPSSIGTLTLASGSITDSSGAISFGNENLSHSGIFATTQVENSTGSDNDTELYFYNDRILLIAGGQAMFDGAEGTQDTIDIGSGADDIDVAVGKSDAIFIEGSSGNITINQDVYMGDTNTARNIILYDAATITMYDVWSDTSVAIGPVADGTTRLDITGSLGVSANLYVADYIYHGTDDSNTAWYFQEDRASLYAGGRTMVDAIETTQDLLYLGYDGSNDIDVSIGPDACLFIEGSSKKVKVTDLFQFPFSTTDPTCDETGEAVYDDTDDHFVFYDANNGELASEEYAITGIRHLSALCDPGSWYDSDTEIFIMTVGDDAPGGIIIDEWKLSCNVDPDVEIDADLRYADAWIGLANAADIDEIDTTNGTSSEDTDSNINSGNAVANGKVIYIGFDADPEGTCTQMIFEMWFHAVD
jgi:hypothetical protein